MATTFFPVPHFDRSASTVKSPVRASFWNRVFNRIVEARMAQAERELERYGHFPRFNAESPVLGTEWNRLNSGS